MRAFRIIFAEALPLRISLSNRSRSSRLSFTTNFLLAMSRPRVGYSRQLKNQCSRSDATTLFKWYKPLGWPGPSSLSLPTSPLELGLQLVLGARDPTVGTMEPHPPLVDLHARNAPARPLASAPPFGAAPSLRHDRTVLRRAGDRGPLHAHSKSHHA